MGLSIEDFRPQKEMFSGCEPGTLVQVRPCDEKYNKKTYIGIFVGDATIGFHKYEKDIVPDRNPMILIPETKSIVFGCESWWGEIKSVDELRQITQEDIENVWYVKLLKSQLEQK